MLRKNATFCFSSIHVILRTARQLLVMEVVELLGRQAVSMHMLRKRSDAISSRLLITIHNIRALDSYTLFPYRPMFFHLGVTTPVGAVCLFSRGHESF